MAEDWATDEASGTYALNELSVVAEVAADVASGRVAGVATTAVAAD